MSVRCREARAADVGAMARLRAASRESEAYWRERIPAYLAGRLDPQQALALRVAFVAEEDGEIVGLAAGHLSRRFGCDGELEWLDVAASRRGEGVSAALLVRLAAWFVEHGAARVCTDVDPGNAGARSFYAWHGALELRPHWMVWEDIGRLAAPGRPPHPAPL